MKQVFLMLVLLVGLGGCMENSYPLDGFSEEQKVLVKAIKAADVEKVKELVKVTDLEMKNDQSLPILTAAMFEAMGDLKSDKPTKRLQIITELVRAGAKVNKGGVFLDSPLTIAFAQEHPALLEAMLAGGLDPNLMDEYSPIIFEIRSNYKLDLMKVLVKYGANIEAKSTSGKNPAHATIITAPKLSYYLVSIGTDVHNVDKNGRSFAMSVFRMEKSLKEDFDDVKSGRYKGNLDVIQENLEAVQKIKAIMIEKGIEWTPKQ
ncbi:MULTISPECIES: hypothetical protein [unclassified Pasteurella]|uniref:hypothetical protein n=1 Tax=unclassified Pasteurella TaxID=2621516 RepID=UPI001072F13D|nr:hypothetical protein [Pasteurella sp. 19428wF3_WM03]TFU49376.1 hypothetical protein E4T92_10895 [Pasteurella sp. WM03]